jgi:hypothetical protein
MLGAVVARRWAELGADVRTTDLRYPHEPLVAWAVEHDLVINAIVAKDGTLDDLWTINARLPVELAARTRLIQPGTDAVGGPYAESKRAGERGIVIRCGLVDIDNQPDPAWRDWLWNGITPLAWADLAWELAAGPNRLVVPQSPPVSRAELAVAVAALFGRPQPTVADSGQPLNRTRLVDGWPVPMPPIAAQLIAYRDWLAT